MCANFGKSHTKNAHVRVRVRSEFWQKAHVRAMCVRPKIKCANVRACEAKNHRNSQFANSTYCHNRVTLFLKEHLFISMVLHVGKLKKYCTGVNGK